MSVVPAAASKTHAEVAESVIDPTIKPYCRPPVAVIPEKSARTPTPIARGPKESHFGRQHPCTGNPVIIGNVVVVGPKARGPDIAISGANGLLIDGQSGRANCDRDPHLRKRRGWNGHNEKSKQKPDRT